MALTSTQHHFAKMYLAAFLRAPDLGGLNYWVNEVNSGKSLQQVGGIIFSLPIVTDIYSASLTDLQFVEAIYGNVFGRASDTEGLNYWSNEIATLRASYSAQGSGNAAFEARGQLVMNMINAGLGTPDGTDGKAYIVNRLNVAEYAAEKQLTTGQEISVANLLSVEAGVDAHPDTVAMGKCRIDSFYDTDAPTQTVFIDNVLDDFGALTGNIAHNGNTDDTTPTLQGHVSAPLAACETLAIYRDGQSIGTTQVFGTGWSFTDTSMGVLGAHTYTARVEDLAGHRGGLSNGYIISITRGDDITPPLPPSLSINDTGASNSDGLTNDGIVTVSGLEAGASWEYSTNGGGFWTAGAGNTFALSGNGAKSVIARQTDAAGNTSGNSPTLGFTLDVAAPTLISAVISSDTLTLSYSETLSPNADAAPSAFSVIVSGSPVSIASVNANGNTVVLTLSQPVLPGTNVSLSYTPPASAATEDFAGNDAAAIVATSVLNETPLPVTTLRSGKLMFDYRSQGQTDTAQALALTDNGRVILTGSHYNGFDSDFLLASINYNPASLERYLEWSTSTNLAAGYYDSALDLAIFPDGTIITAGYADHNTLEENFALARYNADGARNGSFGNAGVVFTDFVNHTDVAMAVHAYADGKVLTAGYASNNAGVYMVAMARYLANGQLDPSFSAGGRLSDQIGAANVTINDLAVQSDGKILVAGRINNAGNLDSIVLRYNSDGSRDTSFADNGLRIIDLGGFDNTYALGLTADGHIILAGHTDFSVLREIAVARLDSDGTLDSSFGSNGIATATPFGNNRSYGYDLLVQDNGGLLVAGQTTSGGTDMLLMRFTEQGAVDTAFGENGAARADFLGSYDYATSLVQLPDGDIMLAGKADNWRNDDVALARFNADGTLDRSFGDYFMSNAQDHITLNGSRFDSTTIHTGFGDRSNLSQLDVIDNFIQGSQHVHVGWMPLGMTRYANVGDTGDLARTLDAVFNGVVGAQYAGLVVIEAGIYAGAYLYVNDENPVYSDTDDIFIQLNNLIYPSGVGAVPVSDYFV
jgi:uncharacterized delta-60 repeat protein